ncbi:hypothetical protein EJB05_02249 [Eragrostis curvula]|uniref:AT-hook motif nuclear-localized protein n=1 Tax=Eragrostis curvula TaxID=38414 RepID=A0A5J9WSF9_9POAL|nr:hypothetical protein EJB05_02249 [Eragrostis curvula]
MEGREGIAVAGGHESGHGLFGADVTMTEAQEAVKEYHSSPSSPSTSPTPSPPPAAPGHGEESTATPLAWSLGGEKPSEVAGDNGMKTAGQGGHANLSSGRRRGRPRGSGRRQILATLGWGPVRMAFYLFGNCPFVCLIDTPKMQQGNGCGCTHNVVFSEGSTLGVHPLCQRTISNVTLRQPDSSGNFTYEGRFEILQLMGSFTMAEEGRRRSGGLSVSLAGPDGRVVGGVVAGMLRAASPIQVIVGSFLPNSLKQHQRRMTLQQPPSATSALPAPMAPPATSSQSAFL